MWLMCVFVWPKPWRPSSFRASLHVGVGNLALSHYTGGFYNESKSAPIPSAVASIVLDLTQDDSIDVRYEVRNVPLDHLENNSDHHHPHFANLRRSQPQRFKPQYAFEGRSSSFRTSDHDLQQSRLTVKGHLSSSSRSNSELATRSESGLFSPGGDDGSTPREQTSRGASPSPIGLDPFAESFGQVIQD